MSDSQHGRPEDMEHPWRDKEYLVHLYEEEGLTMAEIADKLGCTDGTVNSWLKKAKADEIRDSLDVEIPSEKPYKDRELMKKLYVDEELSTNEISAVLDCSTGIVPQWLNKHGIRRRSHTEAMKLAHRDKRTVNFYTHGSKGYEMIKGDEYPYPVHRLQAIAYEGIDAVKGRQVHHKNGIEWDNREENLEVLNARDHMSKKHGGNIWLDRLRAAEMYREGASTYQIAPSFDVSAGTILRWVKEVDHELIRSPGGA